MSAARCARPRFNVISIMTGTGYSSANYAGWGAFATGVFFFIMFIGGCAGSTTCSIKVFRFQVLYQTAKVQMKHLIRPHGVFIGTFNGQPITDEVENSVMSFFFLFMLTFAVLASLLHFIGLDFLDGDFRRGHGDLQCRSGAGRYHRADR